MKKRASKGLSSLDRKYNSFANKFYKKWLASEGETSLTLNPEKYTSGIRVGYSMCCPFKVGDRKFTRHVQRTFALGKATKVPTVLAKSFLENTDLVEFKEAT